MKKLFLLLLLCTVVLFSTQTFAAKKYSVANGKWNSITTWSLTSGGASGAPVPAANDSVYIEGGYNDTLDVSTANTLKLLSIASGSTFVTTSTNIVYATTITVNGYLKRGGTGRIAKTTMNVNSGATFEHAITGDTIPTATWDVNSTCLVTGIINNMCITAVQNFGNFTWNCAGQAFTSATALNDTLKVHNLTVMNTGTNITTGQFRVQNSPITVSGDANISGGIMWVAGQAGKRMTVGGNVNITGDGELDITTGTAAADTGVLCIAGNLALSDSAVLDLSKGTATATGTINLNGNYTQSGGKDTLRVSATGTTGKGVFNFSGTSAQTFSKSGGIISCSNSTNDTLTFKINANAIVDFGTSVLNDNGSSGTHVVFTIASGGGIITAHAQGLSTTAGTGSIQVGGTKTFNAAANYIYNGTVAQVTGNGFRRAAILKINNAAGVTLSQADTVTTLTIGDLTAGSIFNDGGFQLTSTGTLNLTSGSFKLGGTAATTWPAFATRNIAVGTTVEYASTAAQTVSVTPAYQNLTFSGAGQKNVVGTLSVAGNWSTSGGLASMTTSTVTVAGDVAGTGSITFTSGTINVGGVWSNSGTFTAGTGAVAFNGSGSQTVGGGTYNNLTLSGGGAKSLGGAVTVNGILNFAAANNLSLGDNTLTIGTAGSITNAADGRCVVTNGTGVVSRAIAAAGSFTFPVGISTRYNPVAFASLLGGTYTAAIVAGESPITANDLASCMRTWTITGTNPADVTFTWNSNDAGLSINPTSCTAWRYNGAWVDMGGVTTGSDPTYTTTLTGVASFSPWTVGNGGLLPVEMTSFTAVLQGTSALLNWATATETNNSGFQIERSVEGSGVWAEVAFVNGAGTSSSPKTYSYEDKNLAPGKYVYRIKQIDNDGKFIYYTANMPKVDAGISATLQLGGNYPNPFNPTTNIQFSVPQDGYASLKVYNILGQEVATLFSGMAKAGHYIPATFDASRLASGIYFARLQYSGKSLVQRMLLTK